MLCFSDPNPSSFDPPRDCPDLLVYADPNTRNQSYRQVLREVRRLYLQALPCNSSHALLPIQVGLGARTGFNSRWVIRRIPWREQAGGWDCASCCCPSGFSVAAITAVPTTRSVSSACLVRCRQAGSFRATARTSHTPMLDRSAPYSIPRRRSAPSLCVSASPSPWRRGGSAPTSASSPTIRLSRRQK